MGCCAGSKPKQMPPKSGQTIEQVYQKPVQKQEEVIAQRYEEEQVQEIVQAVEQPRKAPEVRAVIPTDSYTLNDIDKIKGASKLTDKEKKNLHKAVLILDSKGRQVTEVIAVICFGFIINTQDNDDKIICMKLVFHDDELIPVNGDENEQQRILNKELEVIKRANDKRVIKYKSHFLDNGKSLNSPALQKMNKDYILFVDLEDTINSTFQDFMNSNRGKLNDRSFLMKAQDLILGLEHLQKQKCITRNLHPERLLISGDDRGTVKYCDFRDAILQDKNSNIKAVNIQMLRQSVNIQSPQIQYYLMSDTSKAITNESSDIWTIGAILSQLGDVDQKSFDAFSSPDNNQGYVGDDQLARINQQKNSLMKLIVSLNPSELTNQSAGINQNRAPAAPIDKQKIDFPGSSKLDDDSNDLLALILDVDESERKIHKIRGNMDYLSIKYHLDAIESRNEPDYMKGKRIDKAPEKTKIKEFESQIASGNNAGAAHYNLASCYFEYEKDKNEIALEHIKKAIAIDGNNARYYNLYGAILERNLLIEQAQQAYKTAIEKDPSYSLPHHNLGYTQQKILQNPGQAIHHYQQALNLDIQNQSSMFNLALVLKDQNKPVEALKYYQQYIKSNPNDSQIYNNLGVLYTQYPEIRDPNNLEESNPTTFFEQAIQKNANDVCALVNLSQAQVNSDYGYEQNESAINKNLNTAEKISPKYAYTYYVKGLTEMVKPNPSWTTAIDYFNTALRCNSAFSLAVYQIGLICYEVDTVKRDLSEVIEYYERAVIYDKNNFLASYSLALAQEELLKQTTDQTLISRLRAKSIANYRKALRVNPKYVEALNNLGVLIKQITIMIGKLKKNSKEYEIIESYLKQAEEIAPNNRIIIDNLQKLYLEVEQDDLAQQSNIKSILVGEE